MKLSLKIIDNNKDIYNSLLKALLPDIINYMDSAIIMIRRELGGIVKKAIFSSPEYSSIVGGDLKYQLGLVDGGSKIEGLLEFWINNISYEYQRPAIKNNMIKSSFSASLIKSDFSDVLGSEYAYMTDNLRGYSLPWLEWLLLNGTAIIINDYTVTMGYNKYSRTGGAVMTNGGSWSIPSQFAGTVGDNWITRSLETASLDIDNLLKKALKS
jgi:hypothetical protein